jgi:hypothetical protein
LLTVNPTVKHVKNIITAIPQTPTNEDAEDPARRLGFAPKKSNFWIILAVKFKNFLFFEILLFRS